MNTARIASENQEIWITHLLQCARHAESAAIPFSDLFGIKTFAYCMKIESKTIREKMNNAGIKPEDVSGVTEAIYSASDISRVFSRG